MTALASVPVVELWKDRLMAFSLKMRGIQRRTHTYTATIRQPVQHVDRIHLSEDLLCNKEGVETTAAAFTDHLAVLIQIKLATPIILRGEADCV